ncbi:hypothetical protein ElyMa_005299200 [Elysia marginata]|uniref:Mutator-like transposase domain-containing protein n=1 Tax=Elysia marginata TaxID=1093978 RepID=A0AAV4JYD2_9GAST|nr:hypothetical protein ElyMa_005299200 [Elysia marginata]
MKTVCEGRLDGRRRKARPPISLVTNLTTACGLSLHQIVQKSQDRAGWQQKVISLIATANTASGDADSLPDEPSSWLESSFHQISTCTEEPQASTSTDKPQASTSTDEPQASTSTTQLQSPSTPDQPGPSTQQESVTPPPPADRVVIPLSSPLPASPEPELPRTRSQQKLSFYQKQAVEEESDIKQTILELPQLDNLLNELGCHECHRDQGLQLVTPSRHGKAVKIEAVCRTCHKILASQYTSARNSTPPSQPMPFVTNGATLMALLLAGMGQYSFNNFCEYLDMPGLHKKTFNAMAKRFHGRNRMLADKIFTHAAAFMPREHIHQYHLDVYDDDIIDIFVQPYGPEVEIEKEDCINHVGKRLGAALRNLVADCSKKGITIGGRGRGLLTHGAIGKLQIYYGRAIRSALSAVEMRRNILASIYHGYSTDDLPQHQYCPPGPSSWCFFKRSIGEHRYPTGHKKRVHTPLDFKLLHKFLEPIYERLASLKLLRKCQLKTIQNPIPNESFLHSVCSRSKKNFHSLKRVEIVMVSAAAEFNWGPIGLATLKRSLG